MKRMRRKLARRPEPVTGVDPYGWQFIEVQIRDGKQKTWVNGRRVS